MSLTARGRAGGAVLSVRNLTLRGAYSDVSFDLAPREILGITGLLGSGRTELVETIFGIAQPDSGSIEIGGRPARLRNVKDAVRAGIGYVPSDRLTEGLFLPQAIERNIVVAVLERLSDWFGVLRRKPSPRRRSAGSRIFRSRRGTRPCRCARFQGATSRRWFSRDGSRTISRSLS